MSPQCTALLESLYHPLTLRVSADHRIRSWEGQPSYYGLSDENLAGSEISEQIPCLFALPTHHYTCLNGVKLDNNRVADLHLCPDQQGYSVMLLDVTDMAENTQEKQQAANELGLLYERLEELSQQLTQRNAELDEANQAKSLFISRMSHEFRTPMISILGHLDWLRRELPEASKAFQSSRSIERSARYLLGLIDNLLNVGKIECGTVDLDLRVVALDEFFAEVRESIMPLASDKRLELNFRLDESANKPVSIDEYHLHQVLLNVLTNAIKYTPSGTVTVSIHHRDERLEIIVEDEGIGIPDEIMEDLFQPFSRATNASGTQGAGLGLSIVKALIDEMGGELNISSTTGAGTRVSMQIPATAVTADHAMAQSAKHVTASPPDTTVFILDDNPDILEIYRLFFEEAGITVELFSDEEKFCGEVLANQPKQIILDYHLDSTDGVTLTSQLRQQGFRGHILMMTATTTISCELYEEAMQAGCNIFVPKPMDVNRLVELVREQAAINE